MKFPKWTIYLVVAVLAVAVFFTAVPSVVTGCPGSLIHCPGVGCVSGPDKCIPGNKGGPSAVFSKEGFEVMKPKPWNADWAASIPPAFRFWPGSSAPSTPPTYGKEGFVSKTCPGKYRSDGPCLMEFA